MFVASQVNCPVIQNQAQALSPIILFPSPFNDVRSYFSVNHTSHLRQIDFCKLVLWVNCIFIIASSKHITDDFEESQLTSIVVMTELPAKCSLVYKVHCNCVKNLRPRFHFACMISQPNFPQRDVFVVFIDVLAYVLELLFQNILNIDLL